MLDTLDTKIIHELLRNSRITWAELAKKVKLSSPSILERVRKLEEKGIITGYTLRLNQELLGNNLLAFIFLSLERPKFRSAFKNAIQKLIEVEECHHVAGDDDYLLKIRCESTKHLDTFLNTLKEIPGIQRTKTTITLSTEKEI